MKATKSRIDKAGLLLSKQSGPEEVEWLELEEVFDGYREDHLQPLSETTLELQSWLGEHGASYYIAQRLKRKPQILRKLRRLSVRLSQLQDIGGLRIIVDQNKDVDNLVRFIESKISQQKDLHLVRSTDYRGRGRDDTGYRAVHLILKKADRFLELQIRSKVQHYWSESIERTSVVYGYHLKEKEGDALVINYFKSLSDIFYEIEAGREPTSRNKLKLDMLRVQSERLIDATDKNKILGSFVNEDIVRTLRQKETSNPAALNNWIMVFDWNSGSFVTWDIVSRDPKEAVRSYVNYEKQFPAEQNFEVVLIGSSDVATVRQTHSHYFGINSYDKILESLEQSIVGFSKRMEMDVGSRQILSVLLRKKYWGKKSVAVSTLRNHYCSGVVTFDTSLEALVKIGLVVMKSPQSPVSLNPKRKAEIEGYL